MHMRTTLILDDDLLERARRSRGAQPWFEYDVASDGQRFLVGTVLDGRGAPPPSAVVVLNWTEELKATTGRP